MAQSKPPAKDAKGSSAAPATQASKPPAKDAKAGKAPEDAKERKREARWLTARCDHDGAWQGWLGLSNTEAEGLRYLQHELGAMKMPGLKLQYHADKKALTATSTIDGSVDYFAFLVSFPMKPGDWPTTEHGEVDIISDRAEDRAEQAFALRMQQLLDPPVYFCERLDKKDAKKRDVALCTRDEAAALKFMASLPDCKFDAKTGVCFTDGTPTAILYAVTLGLAAAKEVLLTGRTHRLQAGADIEASRADALAAAASSSASSSNSAASSSSAMSAASSAASLATACSASAGGVYRPARTGLPPGWKS